MEIVTNVWSLCATVAFVLAVACGLVWLIDRRDRVSLLLCILGVGAGVSAYAELGMMHSATPAEYGEWLRWYHLPVFVAIIAQVLFVHYYLGTARAWLMWAVVFMRSVLLVVNFSVHPNVNFLEIVSLRDVSLFGEQVSAISVAVPRPLQWFAVASLILLMVFLADAVVQRWPKGGRDSKRKAIAVGFGIAGPMLCVVVYGQLLVFGIVQVPISNLPWFLGALVTMAYELGRDVFLSRRARQELAELRDQLAQVERVSGLGPALVHELGQPLAASLANVGAAKIHLRRENPDLEELRAIIGDIGKNDSRAAEIIGRMSQFFKRNTIEMQPLSMEDVVQDVVSQVRSEAASKQVVIDIHIQCGLPRVFGDHVYLSQVLLNLCRNSIHAVQSRPCDARRIVVEARVDDAHGEVEMAVRDSGPGIPASIVKEVFKPFFTTKTEGMGMGLALSRTFIEAHGGRLWSDNTTKQNGAVFRFTLRQAA